MENKKSCIIFANEKREQMNGLYLLILVACAMGFYFIFRLYRYREFQRTMKIGDRCRTHVGEELHKGRIAMICGDRVVVRAEGEVVEVRREDVLPW